MIPINNAAAASSVAQTTVDRRDGVSQSKVVPNATVTENEADTNSKRAESTKIVTKSEKSQAKPRDEERSAKDQSEGHEERRGDLTDVYI